jgi:hypothetical protein
VGDDGKARLQPPAMTFNEVTKAAAKQAVEAVNITVENFQKKYVYDEDDMTGFWLVVCSTAPNSEERT